MDLTTIPRALVGGYVKVLRWPVDRALDVLGRGGEPKLAVDRAEAAARDVAGAALGDDELRRDAAQRRAATDEREEAVRLRAQAQETARRAERTASERKATAARRREQAAERAGAQQQTAERRRSTARRTAARTAQQRRAASQSAVAETEEQIDERAKRERLEQLDREQAALAEREVAVTAADEAARLRDEAGKVKASRKRSNGR
jgi:colicin import membrane protein